VKHLIALIILASVICVTAVGCGGTSTSKGGTTSTSETKSTKT